MQQEGLERNGCDIMEDKIGKGERLITLLQFSRSPSPIQFLCCSKSNPKKCKSDSACTHMRAHTHTHSVPSGKTASSWAKQMSHFITWPLLISSMNSLTPYPTSATHEKPQKQGHCYLLHLLFPQSVTLSYLLFTWLTSAHPSVLKSYFTCHGKISMTVSQSLPMRLS